jgi:hypothetical protein
MNHTVRWMEAHQQGGWRNMTRRINMFRWSKKHDLITLKENRLQVDWETCQKRITRLRKKILNG